MAVGEQLRSLWRTLKRKKVFSSIDIDSGSLKRCLSRWDLTALGVGSTLGVGVYVIVGNVARNIAGPSLVISFLIAAVASLFAGLCYAEFGARVPKAGSAYIYSYVCVGEFIAFIIGWNLILEYMIGTASVARGLSLYVDSILNGSMLQAFEQFAPTNVPWMSPYFDFFAFLIVITLGLGLSFGVRESSSVNNVLSVVNVAVVLFVIIAGSIAGSTSNWSIPATSIPADVEGGAGGFFPYGAAGTLQGAAICFYGFVGFDCIATTGEEVREPRRAIPFAIMLTLLVIFLGYFGVSTVVTMMVPYYAQNIEAPLPYAFSYVGWEWARWLVAIGAIFGLCASLFGAMFPLPRIIYSMASDGLMFRFLGHVTAGRRSPVAATMLSAVLIGLMGALFKLRDLVSMMAIGTLLAYTIVAACVLILRYGKEIELVASEPPAARVVEYYVGPGEPPSARAVCLQLLGVGHGKPSRLTRRIVQLCMLLFVCTSIAMGVVRLYSDELLIPMCTLCAFGLLLMLCIARQPTNKKKLSFRVPLVPLVPCLSIFANIYLMMMLESDAWYKFIIWIAIGIPVYFICLCMYGRRSKVLSNGHLHGNLNHAFDHNTGKSDKSEVTIVVQSPTPTTQRQAEANKTDQNQNHVFGNNTTDVNRVTTIETINHVSQKNNDYTMNIGQIEVDEYKLQAERETQIIELLDQVLEAEEESYAENTNEKNSSDWTEVHSAAVDKLEADAESEASVGVGGTSPSYAVVALVHREDLSRRSTLDDQPFIQILDGPFEDDEKTNEIIKEIIDTQDVEDPEKVEKVLKEIIENAAVIVAEKSIPKEYDEKDISLKLEDSIEKTDVNLPDDPDKHDVKELNEPFIPIPPPMDPLFFSTPTFKRAHTIVVIPRKNTNDDIKEHISRDRTFSGSSMDDTVMESGSDKKVEFMNKLNDILLIPPRPSGAKRSVSSSHILDLDKLDRDEDNYLARQRPAFMLGLKNELLARNSKVNVDIKSGAIKSEETNSNSNSGENSVKESSEDDEAQDLSMSRTDLKSKLENIFASGAPKMLKPRLMSSNPPTPEPSLESSASVEEMFNSASLSGLKDKTEKSDTLKLQRAKFGEVLNSFKITMAKDTNDLGDSV